MAVSGKTRFELLPGFKFTGKMVKIMKFTFLIRKLRIFMTSIYLKNNEKKEERFREDIKIKFLLSL